MNLSIVALTACTEPSALGSNRADSLRCTFVFRLGTVALQERGINSWKGTCVRGFAVGFENVKTLENERERERLRKGVR